MENNSVNTYPKNLSSSVWSAAKHAKTWFDKSAESFDRKTFEKVRITNDNGEGCVYVFYRRNGSVVYVGQTGKRLKYWSFYRVGNHRSKSWWKTVGTVKFVNINNKADRIILAALLAIELKPKNNNKPSAKEIKTMQL